MSATNRGAKRSAYDFYATPNECIEKLLDNFILEKSIINILEPSAGNGNIIKVLRDKGINGTLPVSFSYFLIGFFFITSQHLWDIG